MGHTKWIILVEIGEIIHNDGFYILYKWNIKADYTTYAFDKHYN